MFTGIIEAFGTVVALDPENENLHITIECPFTSELKVDQSVSHNGVCLTVTAIQNNQYTVTAIAETLRKTNVGLLSVNEMVNLERSMVMNGRIDGHIVQGHIDTAGVCTSIEDQQGSWKFTFEYDEELNMITVEKGSVCINGVSLTVIDSGRNTFSVAIIPFTYNHTNFKALREGSVVNIEFDILGKYISKYLSLKS